MFRSGAIRLCGAARAGLGLRPAARGTLPSTPVRFSSEVVETDEQLDARYVAYFERKDIDGWEVRKAMNDLCGMDLVPEPPVVVAAMKACRRINDYSLAVRFLEAVKNKCGDKVGEIYPYLVQEIRPTLDELGIDTPEDLGYDKPELHLKSIYD